MSSRFVSILAPYLTLYLPDLTFDQMPFIVFGIGTLLGSVASCFLPESLGHPLPGTTQCCQLKEIHISQISPWQSWKHYRFNVKMFYKKETNQFLLQTRQRMLAKWASNHFGAGGQIQNCNERLLNKEINLPTTLFRMKYW